MEMEHMYGVVTINTNDGEHTFKPQAQHTPFQLPPKEDLTIIRYMEH